MINDLPTIWQVYKDFMIPGVVLLLAQGLIIFALVRQRAKRSEIRGSEFKEIQDRLREQQVRLNTIVESAMDAIIAIDEAQLIAVFNPAAEKMFRCSSREAIDNPFDRFIPPRLRANYKANMRGFDKTGLTSWAMSAPTALWAQRSDGEEFPIEASISRTDAGGHGLFTVIIIRDVTERKRAEELAARQSAIVESSSDAIISTSLAGIVHSWNAGAQRMFGYTKEETIGKPVTILIPSYLHYEQTELLRRIVAGEHIDNFQTTRVSKSGKILHVAITASPIRDLDGKIAGVSNITRDITTSVLAATTLRESEERFRLVANTAPVMIWMSNPDRACTYFNQRWLDFTGRTFEAEVGDGWMEGVHPEDLKGSLEIYTKAFDKREPYRMEYRLRQYNGEYRWVFAHGVPRFHADGSFAGYIGSCIDVTERKLADEALSTVSRKLIEAQEEERARIARELHDDINQRIALLAASLAHLRRSLPPSALESSRQIDLMYNQAASLGSDVQTMSHRLHSSKLEYLGLEAAAVGLCREFFDQYEVEIEFHSDDIPKNLPKEISLCLFRVLQEALQNAMKHSGSKQFQVTFAMSRNEIRLTVADRGRGFDPKESAKGSGAGLTNMKERLKLVHGDLSIASQPGDGTIVCARVPIGTEAKYAHATA